MRTQVAIIGAGPAGLLLSHLLRLAGVGSVVLERRSREHCEQRIRAGVLEQGTVDTLIEAGLGERMQREGMVHHGIELLFERKRHRIDLTALTGGRAITVYGQHEAVCDMIASAVEHGQPLIFDVADVSLHDLSTDQPWVQFTHDGTVQRIDCDYVAGCDGFHGISRESIPTDALQTFERTPAGRLDLRHARVGIQQRLVLAFLLELRGVLIALALLLALPLLALLGRLRCGYDAKQPSIGCKDTQLPPRAFGGRNFAGQCPPVLGLA